MGDSDNQPIDEPDDDTDWARIYELSPNLWSDFLAEFEELINSGQATPTDYARFTERCLQAVRCLDDTHARLPGLGLTLERYAALREAARKAELAAFEDYVNLRETETEFGWKYRDRQRPRPGDGPLSTELAGLIMNLSLRGLDDQRIACALDVHDTWPAIVRKRIRLHPKAADAVRAHLAGASLGQISERTGVPSATARRILRLIGEQPNGAAKLVSARERARTIVKLRDKGHSYKEITQRLGCSMDDVRNALRRDRQHRYREGRGPAS